MKLSQIRTEGFASAKKANTVIVKTPVSHLINTLQLFHECTYIWRMITNVSNRETLTFKNKKRGDIANFNYPTVFTIRAKHCAGNLNDIWNKMPTDHGAHLSNNSELTLVKLQGPMQYKVVLV